MPGSSSDVLINVAGNPTISYNASTTIHSLMDYDSLNIAGGSLTITSGASQVTGALTVASGATLEINGAGATFTDGTSTTISGANLYTYSGASMTLSAASTYTGSSSGGTIQANGTNGSGTPSSISLPKLTTLTGGTNNNVLYIYAESGATIGLPDVASISTGRIFFWSTGTGSVLDLSKLASMTGDQANNSSIDISGGATIIDPVLTTLNRTDLGDDNPGDTISTAQITSVIGDSIYATAGGVLSLPGVTHVAGTTYGTTIEATGTSGSGGTGTPSTLSLPNLTTLTGGTNNNVLYIYAENGAKLSLPDVASIPSGRIFFWFDRDR